MPKTPDLVLVKWGDAHYGDLDPADCAPYECWDVGFVVRRGKTALKLARSHSPEDGSYRFFMTIPTSGIISVEKLKY